MGSGTAVIGSLVNNTPCGILIIPKFSFVLIWFTQFFLSLYPVQA